MLTLRKIDYYSQFALGIIMLVSIPVLFIYGFLAGLFILGCWQLLSASLNTGCFIASGHSRQIGTYWKWTGILMAMIFACFPLSEMFDPDDVQVLAGIAVVGSVPVAYYYLDIYHNLIETIKLKEELSGLVKSNH